MSLFSTKKLPLAIFILAAGLFAPPLFGQDLPIGRIVDDSAFRASVKESWLLESPGRVLAKQRVVHNLPGGGRIELRTEAGQNEFMIIFARELAMNGGVNGGSQFPGWAQGSWILTRRRDTGAVTRIRVFPRSDPYTYIQFRPSTADKCQMDVVLYDAFVVRSLPVPVPMERLYTLPLSETIKLCGDKFPRRYFEPNPADYREQRQLIANIRERLPELEFADDGAIDQAGRYVHIKTGLEQKKQAEGLNCSGFAKWLIDGILRPVTGKRLEIPPLKEPYGERGTSFTEIWEEVRDPHFGLDWIRNLSSSAWAVLRSPAFGNLDEFEVRTEPFSQVIIRKGSSATIQSYPGFMENAGYNTEGLHALLYTLAIDEPGRFYLAAVNNEIGPPTTESNLRGRPRMRQYFHVAALVPYFNGRGVFQIAVFESAAETSFSAFKNRYPGQQVNLVRIPVETVFDP